MARLAAIAKSLYYPTQDRVLSLLLEKIKIQVEGEGWILDPCCGTGQALDSMAKAWNLKSIGVELDASRYQEAYNKLDSCYFGSIHQIHIEKNTSPSIVFLNPPYDYDEEGRQETEFLRVASNFMTAGSFLILIVPHKILGSYQTRSLLSENFTHLKVWKYPDPEYSQFKQIVILGQKKTNSLRYGFTQWGQDYLPGVSSPLTILGEEECQAVIQERKCSLSMKSLNFEDLAPSSDEGVYASVSWDLLLGNKKNQTANPLMPPRSGHRAMMLVSGYLNGLEVDGKLIKGRTIKTSSKIEGDEKVIFREQLTSIISELDLKEKKYESWNAKEETDRTIEWFDQNGCFLSTALEKAYTPQWNGDLSKYDFDQFIAPGVLPGRNKPEFLEKQKQVAAAIAFRLKSYKSTILCGEQGTGKTSMATMAMRLFNENKKTVIICPSHLVDKWKRETQKVCQRKGIASFAEKISDVIYFFSWESQLKRFILNQPEPKFLIISKERAKLGARWKPAAIEKVKTYKIGEETRSVKSAKCPDCGIQIKRSSDYWEDKKRASCEECKTPLWQSTPISDKGTKRWALAHFISKHYANSFNLILDETHAFAKAETDQSRAVQMLCSSAEKILAMTGTLYGGRASSLFHLLYKIDPTFREIYEYTDAKKFSQQHGLFETIFKEEEYTSISGYRRGQSGGRLKEIPGVSPTMINLLLHFTIFVKLKDLGVELPDYQEEVRLIEPDIEVLREVQRLNNSVRSLLRKNPSLIGAFLMSSLGYVDAPENGDEIYLRKENSPDELIATLPSIEKEFLPKDEELLKIIQENKSQGRQVLVYFTQTKKRNPIPRIKRFLESKGLKVVHMPSSVAPKKREAWVRKALKEGFDVFLTNGRLVETGLDLLFAKTIVQYGIEYSINSLRQSIRRSWRLGQDHDIKVIFFAYAKTLQQEAIQLIAKKMKAAELLDGEDEFSGLSQHDDSAQDLLLELAQKVMREE